MDHGPLERTTHDELTENLNVVALAVRALAFLASREEGSHKRTQEALVKELCEAFIHSDESRRYAVVSRMIASGITSTEFVDVYVPLVARKLGEAWVDDAMSFVEVTVGAARLQETVRSLGGADRPGVTIPLGHRVLLVIPQEENHTLGAFIAASQFRRYGLWVHMAIGQSPGEVVETVRADNFQMIGISSSGRQSLESVNQLVRAIKSGCPSAAPIVLGGNLCNIEKRAQEFTGVDFVTTNPRQALGYCGLTANPEQAICDATGI